MGHVPSTYNACASYPRWLHPDRSRQGCVFQKVWGNESKPSNVNDPRPNEIIHLKEYSPLNTYYGIPDVIAALQAIKGDQFASQYNIDYFENKAVPRYIVTVKGAQLSPESEERLFRFLQTGLKGQNHRTCMCLYPLMPTATRLILKCIL